ncbi:MAG: hypothetical protein ABIN36_06805 [Ferruginibacter sp.]
MIHHIMKGSLMTMILLNCNFCFGQIENLHFTIDTDLLKDSVIHEFDFYKDSVIRCRSFYTSRKDKVHYEYIKLNPDKFYCIEYDTTCKKIAVGVVKKETRPFYILEIPEYDSNGNVIRIGKTGQFKFCKDEYWKENIEGYGNYISGIYINGKKDSAWVQYKNWFPEQRKYYDKGNYFKDEKINIAGSQAQKIKELLTEKKWIVQKFSMTETQAFLLQKSNDSNDRFYIYFKSNDSCEWFMRSAHDGNYIKNGSWKLNENSILEIKLEKDKLFQATIDYLSEYGLILTFK